MDRYPEKPFRDVCLYAAIARPCPTLCGYEETLARLVVARKLKLAKYNGSPV